MIVLAIWLALRWDARDADRRAEDSYQAERRQLEHIDLRNLVDRRETQKISRLTSRLNSLQNGQTHDHHPVTLTIHGSPSDLNKNLDFAEMIGAAFLIRENDDRAKLEFTKPERVDEPFWPLKDRAERTYNIKGR
jgi:hypothetical protein